MVEVEIEILRGALRAKRQEITLSEDDLRRDRRGGGSVVCGDDGKIAFEQDKLALFNSNEVRCNIIVILSICHEIISLRKLVALSCWTRLGNRPLKGPTLLLPEPHEVNETTQGAEVELSVNSPHCCQIGLLPGRRSRLPILGQTPYLYVVGRFPVLLKLTLSCLAKAMMTPRYR